MGITLVTGGARSGKSSFAQKIAADKKNELKTENTSVIYLATSLIGDEEMLRRVEIHRRSRPADWISIEEPYQLCRALDELPPSTGIVLVDCLTIWLTNLLFNYLNEENSAWALKKEGWQQAEEPFFGNGSIVKEERLEKYLLDEVKQFVEKIRRLPLAFILVSNEVGWGIVPEHYLGRLFRDIAGKANQFIATKAEAVYLVVAGIPLKIKG